MNQAQFIIAKINKALLGTIKDVNDGGDGAPSGVVYAALMTQGATLNQFNSLTSALINKGYLIKKDDCFFITTKGREYQNFLAINF